MMRLIYAPAGVVQELLSPPKGAKLGECFHPDFLAECTEVAEGSPLPGLGWVRSGDGWVEPPQVRQATPSVVQLWQFRREMQSRGWWTALLKAAAALPADQRDDVTEWLEYGSDVRRDSPMLAALAASLGIGAELDVAFCAAAERSIGGLAPSNKL
jgi:hypothetical protein